MADYSRPNYTDGYEIGYNRETDLFECRKDGVVLARKDGKPAAYKSTGPAKKFMESIGAQIAEEPKKPQGWTRPTSANIPPLEEQLAALPADAPRFVVVEAGYGFYKEQGYAVYDREERDLVSPHTYRGWNSVTESREKAEQEAAYRAEHPPVKHTYHPEFARVLANHNAEDMGSFDQIMLEEDRKYEQGIKEPAPVPPAEKETTFLSGPYQVGDIITDKHGRKYRVTHESYFLSSEEVDELEEGFDIFEDIGWHTRAELVEE